MPNYPGSQGIDGFGLTLIRLEHWRENMGFASYREDIARIRDDAAHFRRLLDHHGPQTISKPVDAAKEADRRIRSYCRSLDGIIAQFDRLLAIATEPDIILADEVRRLRVERDEAVAKANELRQRLAEADAAQQRAAEEFGAKLAEQKGLVADLRKRVRQTEEKFERLATEDFGAAVAIYAPKPGRG